MRTSLIFFILLTACGVEKIKPESKVAKKTWAEISQVVVRECVRCHNGVKHPLDLSLEENFKNSNSQARIQDDSMPKDKKLNEIDRSLLLSYF